MKRHVVGSYASPQEAVEAVKKLQGEGYQKDDITLVSSTESRNLISNTAATDVEVSTDEAVTDRTSKNDNTDDRSVWEKIKGSFSTSDHDDTVSTSSDDDPLYSYQKDIANGNIIVMVNGELKDIDESSSKTAGNVTTPLDPNPMAGTDTMTNSQPTMEPTVPETSADLDSTKQNQQEANDTIQLKEEQIDVSTREVQTGEVRATKRIVEEIKTVDVPVRHEEVVIERHKLTNGSNSDGITEDDEIIIPISEEKIEITKHPVVKEEVSINKKEIEDTKQVSETVRKEDIDVETDGDIHIKGNNQSDRP